MSENAYGDAVADWDDTWMAFEEEVLDLVNQRRAAGADCGETGTFDPAGPLTMNPALRCAARNHSMDMGTRNYFAHGGARPRRAARPGRARGVDVGGEHRWGIRDAGGRRLRLDEQPRPLCQHHARPVDGNRHRLLRRKPLDADIRPAVMQLRA